MADQEVYYRTPDGMFWQVVDGKVDPMRDMAHVHEVGIRPVIRVAGVRLLSDQANNSICPVGQKKEMSFVV